MNLNRRKMFALGAAAFATGTGVASAEPAVAASARSLSGDFRDGYATVNGVRLHYVAGGRGEPLFLLPGWPQTWWEFRKVLPALAKRYRVIAVDLRGMGGSAKPATGYDKKTMARDIRELARHLGYPRIAVAGHDIGSMVAHSFAVNHPEATSKVVLMDVPHPDESLYTIPLLPKPGEFSPWWFSLNQVRDLPEQLLAGRFRPMVDWLFDHIMVHPEANTDRDRAIFAQAYNTPDAIRAGNAWYQTFSQDIEDQKAYGKITAPLLGLSTEATDGFLQYLWPSQGTDVRVEKVADSGHFLVEEQPEAVVRLMTGFLG